MKRVQHGHPLGQLDRVRVEGVRADRVRPLAPHGREHPLKCIAHVAHPSGLAAARHHQGTSRAGRNRNGVKLDPGNARALGAVDRDVVAAPGEPLCEVRHQGLRAARRGRHGQHRRRDERDPHRRIVRP